MTSNEKKQKYEQLISGGEVLESRLHENLIEHLNAEIVLQTVSSREGAVEWLKSSFLSVRIKKNPSYYKLGNIASTLEKICMHELDLLAHHGFLIDGADGLRATEYGAALAKYYLKFQTVVNLIELKPRAGVADLLDCICRAQELAAAVRFSGDKTVLNNMNKTHGLRFPIAGRIKQVSDKVSLLLQFSYGAIPFPDKVYFSNAAKLCNGLAVHQQISQPLFKGNH